MAKTVKPAITNSLRLVAGPWCGASELDIADSIAGATVRH
jgi:hypothetical protein